MYWLGKLSRLILKTTYVKIYTHTCFVAGLGRCLLKTAFLQKAQKNHCLRYAKSPFERIQF